MLPHRLIAELEISTSM